MTVNHPEPHHTGHPFSGVSKDFKEIYDSSPQGQGFLYLTYTVSNSSTQDTITSELVNHPY